MGWTSTYITPMLPMKDVRAFLESQNGCKIVSHKFGCSYGVFNSDTIKNLIVVILWKYNRTSGDIAWKDIPEDMHPYYFDIPLKWIAEPCSIPSEGGTAWRSMVRQKVAERKERLAFVKSLKRGDRFIYCGKEYVYEGMHGKKPTGWDGLKLYGFKTRSMQPVVQAS